MISKNLNIYCKKFYLDESLDIHRGQNHSNGHPVAYLEDLNYFFDQKTEKYYDLRPDPDLTDEIQLVMKKYNSFEEIKEKSSIELIA